MSNQRKRCDIARKKIGVNGNRATAGNVCILVMVVRQYLMLSFSIVNRKWIVTWSRAATDVCSYGPAHPPGFRR